MTLIFNNRGANLVTTCCFVVAMLGLTLSVGCNRGDDVDRCVVTGTVTYDGSPLPNGEIRFRADSGPLSGGPIKDGKYKIDHKGGVPTGNHTVTVTAYRMIKSSNGPDGIELDGGGDEQYIPKKYNKESTLTVAITGEDNPTTRDFDLQK